MDSSGDRHIGFHASIENGHPVEAHQEFPGIAQGEVGDDLEVLEVEIRLVEAIEQHQPIGAGLIELHHHVGNGAEIGAEFYRYRNSNATLHFRHQVALHGFDLYAVEGRIYGKVIDVQLERIGPGFLDEPGIADPAAGGHAVEASDHRNPDSPLGLMQV